MPLSVFDKITYNAHVAIIYAYRPPIPPTLNATIEYGLKRALSEYREWAGRLGENEKGDPVILLNDKGVKLVEASVDRKLDEVMPMEPTSVLLGLHPSLKDVEELMQVQLTKFACGSLVLGFTAHHMIADGHGTSNFLIAWAKASRGLSMEPLPLHDRDIFKPRNPPILEFEHRDVEYKTKELIVGDSPNHHDFADDIAIKQFHFSLDFLSKLKARASSDGSSKPYTTFECLVAHLWRTLTEARGLSGSGKIQVRISVNGRMRMNPRVPSEFFGNLVLWTYPTSSIDDILREPLCYAAKLIHDSIAKLDHKYFQSFIDFATHTVEQERLVPTAGMDKVYPNYVDIDSWLRFPFNELDFGGGRPYLFMPSYFPMDGDIILTPSLRDDGSIVAFIPLFKHHMATFKQIVYSLD